MIAVHFLFGLIGNLVVSMKWQKAWLDHNYSLDWTTGLTHFCAHSSNKPIHAIRIIMYQVTYTPHLVATVFQEQKSDSNDECEQNSIHSQTA